MRTLKLGLALGAGGTKGAAHVGVLRVLDEAGIRPEVVAGTSIGSLVIFAVFSGFFIIGLTLYSSAVDRIRDYGTLKAIGATNQYITRLILTQSFLFAVVGFIIAVILLEGFKAGVSNAGLLIKYSIREYTVLFLVTVFISVGSSLFFAIRTIRNVEPAAVFRG